MNSNRVKQKEQVEDVVVSCLSEIYQFEEDADNITILEYGGGSEESFLKGSRNALRLFALDILRKTCGLDSETGILGSFDVQSSVGIDYIEIAGNVHSPRTSTITDSIMIFILLVCVIVFLLSALVGLLTLVKWIFS